MAGQQIKVCFEEWFWWDVLASVAEFGDVKVPDLAAAHPGCGIARSIERLPACFTAFL